MRDIEDMINDKDILEAIDSNSWDELRAILDYNDYCHLCCICWNAGIDMPVYEGDLMLRQKFDKPEGLKTLNIPSYIRYLNSSVFIYSVLEKIILNNGLKKIKERCFASSDIKEIDIPDTVEFIGEEAFVYCHSLEKVKLPKNKKNFNIPVKCFYGCDNLKAVSIPDNFTIIREGAFKDCYLKKVKLPKTIKEIRTSAFRNFNVNKNCIIPDIQYEGTKEDFNKIKLDKGGPFGDQWSFESGQIIHCTDGDYIFKKYNK